MKPIAPFTLVPLRVAFAQLKSIEMRSGDWPLLCNPTTIRAGNRRAVWQDSL